MKKDKDKKRKEIIGQKEEINRKTDLRGQNQKKVKGKQDQEDRISRLEIKKNARD